MGKEKSGWSYWVGFALGVSLTAMVILMSAG